MNIARPAFYERVYSEASSYSTPYRNFYVKVPMREYIYTNVYIELSIYTESKHECLVFFDKACCFDHAGCAVDLVSF